MKITGLIKLVDIDENFQSPRIMENGKKFLQPYIRYVYVGYYDGPIMFADGKTEEKDQGTSGRVY